MYETEVNDRVEGADQLPAEIQARFRELTASVSARTVLPWGEHCTECVWPTCYTSCDLYEARDDGKCRRFVDGMVRLDLAGSANGYVVKIRFKQWGKLWTAGNVHLLSPAESRSAEQWDRRVGAVLYQIALPSPVKRFATWRRYNHKKQVAQHRPASPALPDAFIVECYNPGAAVTISLTLRAFDESQLVPFQRLLDIPAGYSRSAIPTADIVRTFDLRAPFNVELIPNNVPDGTTLYFGMLDFASGAVLPPAAAPPAKSKTKTIKAVVWDLDNTMWQGTLVEDGASNLVLKPGIAEIIKQLDARGILLSVASKNNADEALKVLKGFGLDEYFLYPQISWGPKSEAIKAIATQLNIGIDTLMFVDDSEFELAQVRSACPDVRLLDAAAYASILDLPETQVTVTAEAADRRKMYRTDAVRQTAATQFGDDYFAFLRDCQLEAHLRPMTAANLTRVHELTQRTNQMNFSGNRYERAVLERVLGDPSLDTFVMECRDRFGDYGVVGFCIADNREPRITDLMFSCRVQSKRVEHALLTYLLRRYRDGRPANVYANYRKTPRNAPSGRVFDDVGFQIASETDGVLSLVFPQERDIPDDGIVSVIYHGQ